LLEVKGHPGHVTNRGAAWSVKPEGSNLSLTLRNPLHLLDVKSKALRGRLQVAARRRGLPQHIPRIEPAVFLYAVNLRSALDEVQRVRVYGRDGACEGLPEIWLDLLDRPPRQSSDRITAEFARDVLPELLDEIGISAS